MEEIRIKSLELSICVPPPGVQVELIALCKCPRIIALLHPSHLPLPARPHIHCNNNKLTVCKVPPCVGVCAM